MRILKSMLPALVIASLLSSLSYAVAPDRISGALNSGQTVPLRGNVHHLAQPQFDEGPVDPAMRLGTITLTTVPTAAQQRAINQLLAQQQDPKSSNYHQWITPEQYADRFGLSQNDMQQMAAWLKSKGFTMIHPSRSRNWISFTGTAAQVQSAFGAEIHHFNVNGELHYANATAPQIPAAVGGVVTGFRGLDDFRPRPHGIRRNTGLHPDYNSANFGNLIAPGDIATIYDINALYAAGIDGSGQTIAVMGQTDIYLADITDFRTGFGLSPINCTTNGSGVITACNDPHFFYQAYSDPGLSQNGDISEADLDLEWSGAVARGAQIIYVNSSDTFTSYYNAVADNLSPVISLSYGFCEFYDNILSSDESVLVQASTQGISFVNSSGDAGAAECDYSATVTQTPPKNLAQQGIAVSYPASSPEVTGVGGTAIPLANFTSQYWSTSSTNPTDGGTALSYIPEQAWNDDSEIFQFCQANPSSTFCSTGNGTGTAITSAATAQNVIGISSTGGGASNCSVQTANNTACVSGFPKPSWQTVTITGQTTRLTPDVSFLATPNFPGFIFCTQLSELGISGTGSSCASGISNAVENDGSLIGGTSASAPIFAGMVAILNQYTASSGLGNVNPMLYSLAGTPSNLAFHPVTTSNNTVYCVAGTPSTQPVALRCPGTGVLGFQASNSDSTTGYNMVTGLGSVDLNNLAIAWAGTLTPGFTFTPTAASYQVSQGGTVNAVMTVAMVGGYNQTISFTCTDPVPGSLCTVPPNVNSTQGVSFNITTTAPTAAALRPSGRDSSIFYAVLFPGLLGIMFTAGSRRRSLRGMRYLGLIIVLGFSTMWLASCGGGSGNGVTNPGTPKGTYTITVTAAAGTTSIPQTFNVVVQ
jgi:subtilase family serine protease